MFWLGISLRLRLRISLRLRLRVRLRLLRLRIRRSRLDVSLSLLHRPLVHWPLTHRWLIHWLLDRSRIHRRLTLISLLGWLLTHRPRIRIRLHGLRVHRPLIYWSRLRGILPGNLRVSLNNLLGASLNRLRSLHGNSLLHRLLHWLLHWLLHRLLHWLLHSLPSWIPHRLHRDILLLVQRSVCGRRRTSRASLHPRAPIPLSLLGNRRKRLLILRWLRRSRLTAAILNRPLWHSRIPGHRQATSLLNIHRRIRCDRNRLNVSLVDRFPLHTHDSAILNGLSRSKRRICCGRRSGSECIRALS